jgi:alcohol dehydrogenase (cytochrome c)
MDPGLANQDRNRGAALWGNLVISVTGYAGRVIATDKETGKIVWDKNLLDQADLELTAAPLALKDLIVIGGLAATVGCGTGGSARPQDRETKWKTYSIPAPGGPAADLKDNHTWQTGGGAFFGTGAYDPSTNLTYWVRAIRFRPTIRATVRATTSTLTARLRSMWRVAGLRGTSSIRRTTTTTTTRLAATS